ncbi:hypothetical protein LEP1GSC047_2134 [Leptospira inadai serovar Lyme str. 10]|uniref:Uncharacterized protein n=2 Tax=Leptospira inadai serovar Lyme TaxID=293084 RepID=V6HFS1_9LEPT|nr:hypothetical protein [Leptospira inadai]EQA38693.1 hypothetical protein LEP1GSC047_2134 [Leptospira inadai serovar Lyme str. 10]PNV72639.1 hypothetical protein BES34_018950 [Leptospira inadai serovar Lyme]
MPTFFRPYYIDANDQKVILTNDASVLQAATAALIAQFPQIATIGQESIRANLVSPLAQGNSSPLPFLQLAVTAYASIQGDENLPDGDATTKLRLDFSAGDPCIITITASLPDPTLSLAQLQYVLTLSDQIMNFFSFEVVDSKGQNLVYGTSEDAVLDYLVIFNLLSAYALSTNQELSRKIPRQNTLFTKGLKQCIDFSDFIGEKAKYSRFTITKTIANVLFVDRAKPSDWYPVRLGDDNTVLDRINLIGIGSGALNQQGQTKLKTTIFFSQGGDYSSALSTIDFINSKDFNVDRIPSLISRTSVDASLLTNRRVYYYNTGGNLLAYLGEYIPETFGGVGGRGRADSPDENEFLWTGNIATGYAIGLPLKNYLGFSGINPSGFFITNTPMEKFFTTGKSKSTSSIALAAYPILEELGYYKKQKMVGMTVVPRKNLPKVYEKPRVFMNLPPRKNFKSIGEGANRKILHKKIMKGEIDSDTKETKGLPLQHSESQERENAGSVMKKYLFSTKFSEGMHVDGDDTFSDKYITYYTKKYHAPFPGSSLSATDFTNYTASEDGETTDAIRTFPTDVPYLLKKDPYYEVVTDQEWCHLFGHGDGGPDIPKNFVSGSKHCNTEQLAIETGQRKRKIEGITAKITAYLLPTSDIWFNAGTEADVKYGRDILPLAHVMRYKVYDAKKSKAFDHWYDAQAQSFDYNEFLILEEFVDRKTSVGDDIASLEYRGSLIARFLDRLFKDCKTNDIAYDDAALKPFCDFPSGYKTAKSKKTDRQNTVVLFLQGEGKTVLEQFIFDEKLSLLATKSLPRIVQNLFLQIIAKSQ